MGWTGGSYRLRSEAGESTQPSGRLQVLEPKDFPYLHTGKSLVFVIAPNGYVFGKRLDMQSGHHDIELEIFWPCEDGCLVRRLVGGDLKEKPTHFSDGESLVLFLKHSNSITTSQREKVFSILSQKEIIQYELGTLMVRPEVDITDHNYKQALPYRRMDKTVPLLRDFKNEPCNIKVVDCSFGERVQKSMLECWCFFYDYASCEFKFFSNNLYAGGAKWQVGSLSEPKTYLDVPAYQSVQSNATTTYSVAMASDKKFSFSRGQSFMHQKNKSVLRVMYGEFDFFDFFNVDDAFLMLEEVLYGNGRIERQWTLGIAQNKHVREMTRLASNNPDLFAPILSPTRRRVGGGVTDTV